MIDIYYDLLNTMALNSKIIDYCLFVIAIILFLVYIIMQIRQALIK